MSDAYRIGKTKLLAAGTAREANGRQTIYVFARFATTEETCTIYLRYLDADGKRDGRSDSRTMAATTERDGADGGSGNYLSVDEPFDVPCHSYAIVVEEAPGAGAVTFSLREVGA